MESLLREAGAGEVVVDEALGAEPRQETLGDALFQVQVDGVGGELLGGCRGSSRDWQADRR